jgi:hypothetical protein
MGETSVDTNGPNRGVFKLNTHIWSPTFPQEFKFTGGGAQVVMNGAETVCVCVCARARVSVRACVRVCVRACV